MRSVLVAAVMMAFAGAASAGDFPLGGPTARTVALDARSGGAVPVVTRLQPVVGSVQRTGHFAHPHTGKTKYTGTVYNPVLGQFGTHTFRR